MLQQVVQRSCECSIIGSVQAQVGWNSEQPGLVEDFPAHGRGVGMVPFNPKHSIIPSVSSTILWGVCTC